MKRILTVFLFAVLVCALAIPVFANDGGPAFSNYDVVCPKKVDYFKMDYETEKLTKVGTFSAGTVLEVWYEYEYGGVVYADVEIKESEEYEGFCVKLADVQLKDENYLPEEGVRLEQSYSVFVIAPDGIEMRKGPNRIFPIVTTVPKNTRLTFSIANDDFYEGKRASWAYVTYRQNSGWIYIYREDVENGVAEIPGDEDNATIWVLDSNVQIYKGLSNANLKTALSAETVSEFEKYYKEDDAEYYKEIFEGTPDRVIGTLRQGEQYKYKYSHNCNFGVWYYVTAGLRSGWVFCGYENSSVAVSTQTYHPKELKAFRSFELKLYETPNHSSAYSTVPIPKDTVLNPSFHVSRDSYDDFYYETIDGKSGWWSDEAIYENTISAVRDRYEKEYNTKYEGKDGGTPIYSDIVKRDKKIGTIPAGAHPDILYSGGYNYAQRIDLIDEYIPICYIRYQNLNGWVLRNDLYNSEEEERAEEAVVEETTEHINEDEWALDEDYENEYFGDEEPEPEEQEEALEYTYAEESTRRGLMPGQIVLICICGAVVLALAATISLILIRRNRKAKDSPELEVGRTANSEEDDSIENETDTNEEQEI